MTSKVDLLELAKEKYAEKDVTIRCIITAITEAKFQQESAIFGMRSNFEIIEYAVKTNTYVTTSDASLITRTSDYVAATAKLATLFYTLACALQAHGEQIEY